MSDIIKNIQENKDDIDHIYLKENLEYRITKLKTSEIGRQIIEKIRFNDTFMNARHLRNVRESKCLQEGDFLDESINLRLSPFKYITYKSRRN